MRCINIKMVLKEAVGSIGNTNYWGLCQQKGPWKSVSRDRANAKSSLNNKFFKGGGVQGGGTVNAGSGGWYSQMTPNPAYGQRGPPPKPSRYAQRRVTFSREEYGYKQRVGKPAIGAHYPASGGQFPGSKPRTEQVFQGGAGQQVADDVTSHVLAPIPDLIGESTDDDVEMGLPSRSSSSSIEDFNGNKRHHNTGLTRVDHDVDLPGGKRQKTHENTHVGKKRKPSSHLVNPKGKTNLESVDATLSFPKPKIVKIPYNRGHFG